MAAIRPGALDVLRAEICKLSAGARIEVAMRDGSMIIFTAPAEIHSTKANLTDVESAEVLTRMLAGLPDGSNVTVIFADNSSYSRNNSQPAGKLAAGAPAMTQPPQPSEAGAPPQTQRPAEPSALPPAAAPPPALNAAAPPAAAPPAPTANSMVSLPIKAPANLGATRMVNFVHGGVNYRVKVPDNVKPGEQFVVKVESRAPAMPPAAAPGSLPPAQPPRPRLPDATVAGAVAGCPACLGRHRPHTCGKAREAGPAPLPAQAPAPNFPGAAPPGGVPGAVPNLNDQRPIPKGTQVVIQGLVSSAHLNGHMAVISDLNQDGRYTVTLASPNGPKLVSLRPQNIMLPTAGYSAQLPPQPPLQPPAQTRPPPASATQNPYNTQATPPIAPSAAATAQAAAAPLTRSGRGPG